MGAEIKSAFLTMLHVTPEYIKVVSNPAEIIVDEDASEIIIPLRGYMAAKHTSRESWQRFRQRKEFEWTKITFEWTKITGIPPAEAVDLADEQGTPLFLSP